MEQYPQIVRSIRAKKTQPEFAKLLGLSVETVQSYETGRRQPGHDGIAALLRVAEPPHQRQLLEALGIEDVEQFASDLLASVDVAEVQVVAKDGGNGKEQA